jgi:hypothetical protein
MILYLIHPLASAPKPFTLVYHQQLHFYHGIINTPIMVFTMSITHVWKVKSVEEQTSYQMDST